MQTREIQRFYNSGLYDFRSFILPDVFDDLLIAEDYNDMQIVCAGALEDGVPVGAAIAQLLENNEVYLQSIIVADEKQRQGIGTDLLNGILREAFAEFSSDNEIEAMPTNLSFHIDYVLPKDEKEKFDAFLKKFGFAEFYEMENCCYIDGAKLLVPDNFAKPNNIISFADDANGNTEELEEYLKYNKLNVSADNAFILTDGEKTKATIFAENGTDNEYFVRCFAAEGEEVSDKEFEDLFYTLASAVKKENPDFIFVIDEHDITNPDCLEKLAAGALKLFGHTEAGYYAVFSQKK